MAAFGQFWLDKEKDLIVDMDMDGDRLTYVLRTPNHSTGNLITNLAALCGLPLSFDAHGMKVIRGEIPCYIDAEGRRIYIFRLRDTKIANIFPDGTVERKAAIPAISKTLMSQTKDYHLDFAKTVVKTWILEDVKFRTDLHTHMNAILAPDILIALGIHHQIGYPLYYIRKLGLRCTERQAALLAQRRQEAEARLADLPLTGKYRDRRIDDNTFINFADLILGNLADAAYNIPRIRASLAVMKDGQAVFTNLEKVYLYRYVFTRGAPAEDPAGPYDPAQVPDRDIARALRRMAEDRRDPRWVHNTLFQDKLLWIARSYAKQRIRYVEISDTNLVRKDRAAEVLRQIHAVMPDIEAETGVTVRFLAAIRRIPLTIVKDRVGTADYVRENLQTLRAVAADPWVAGSDIVGEEINDIRDLRPVIREIVAIAAEEPGFVVRIHAGENDSLRDNVANSIRCVTEALAPGQPMPRLRIGHGLYTANLNSVKGRQLIERLRAAGAVLEFQITSNVRLNNLSSLAHHPLKQYLQAGVRCVQGTDGGALYGTDSIDEQLSLEKMLDLSREDLRRMRATEDEVIAASLADFERKKAAFAQMLGGRTPEALLTERLEAAPDRSEALTAGARRLDSAEALADRIEELPAEGVPLVLLGGSFNSDRHHTRVHPEDSALIDAVLDGADPEQVYFVIGHRLTGQEKILAERCRGRFRVWAFVPTRITRAEADRLRAAGVKIRVSIEAAAMGVYKSVAYEVFKRRPSVMLAFDGNSAGCNTIQEARNAKHRCRIHVSARSRLLRAKARTLEGYVTLFSDPAAAAEAVLRDLRTAAEESGAQLPPVR